MLTDHSIGKVSHEHVDRIVNSILTKRQRNVREQQKIFVRRATEENQKRNNYVVEKYTLKRRNTSSKENRMDSFPPPKKKAVENNDDDDDDFISTTKKRPKMIPPVIKPAPLPAAAPVVDIDPVRECLESILVEIEQSDVSCPICNCVSFELMTLDQRQEHVHRCLAESHFNNIEIKQQKSLLSYSNFSSANIIRKTALSTLKCQICGLSFSVKRTYLAHLKKCSTQNSVQLKHVINFAAKTTPTEPPPLTKKKPVPTIKNRVIKMEMPRTEDDEQQQLAIAISTSMAPINAFDLLQVAPKKSSKVPIDLTTTPLWNVSSEDKIKQCADRLSNVCERLLPSSSTCSSTYTFFPSPLGHISQATFGTVNWWNITTTDPGDDEIPMTQLARVMAENDDDPEC